MTYTRLIVLVACFTAWWTAPVDLYAQGTSSAATSMQTWRRTSQGLSSNAALAFYRVQNMGHPAQRSFALRQPTNLPATTLYSTPYYAVTTNRTVAGNLATYYPATIFSATGSSATGTPQTLRAYPRSRLELSSGRESLNNQEVLGRAVKPFAGVQHPPNAFQRYWPYLLEAREDPATGLVIWTLP